MRHEVQLFLSSRPDLARFVREKPIWYRLLSRSPEKMYQIEQEARIFYGQTFSQRIDRIQQQVQLVQILMNMMYAMGSDN